VFCSMTTCPRTHLFVVKYVSIYLIGYDVCIYIYGGPTGRYIKYIILYIIYFELVQCFWVVLEIERTCTWRTRATCRHVITSMPLKIIIYVLFLGFKIYIFVIFVIDDQLSITSGLLTRTPNSFVCCPSSPTCNHPRRHFVVGI